MRKPIVRNRRYRPTMDILLIPGLWLDGSAWDEVVPVLAARGHRPRPLTLPGAGGGSSAATLDDQVDAVVDAIDASDGRCLVVGHSAATSLAWIAVDRRPESVAGVVFIGGFPSGNSEQYAAFFPMEGGAMPFPGWTPFEGPDAADLDAAAREALVAKAIPVPEAVATGVVRLTDERRYDVPAVVVCPEFSPAQAQGWIDGGEAPELASTRAVDLVDIDSGHWPMLTQPRALADLLAGVAERLERPVAG